MSFKLNGTAAFTSSGSSSDAKLVPPPESASPSLLMAMWRIEQPVKVTARNNSPHHLPQRWASRHFKTGWRMARVFYRTPAQEQAFIPPAILPAAM